MQSLSIEKLKTDVLVIGADAGGMMPAISAADEGVDVTLCEKGNARRSGGITAGNDHFFCYIPEIHGKDVRRNFIHSMIVESLMDAAKDNAVYRWDDGIVLIDPEKAKDQNYITTACPYRVIYWNAEKQIPQKCTMCAHRLDEGEKMPRCVESCPTGALIFGDLDDPESEIAKQVAELDTEYLHPEFNTQPLIKYMGIPQRFIVGEVILKDRQDECAQDVTVLLMGNGRTMETVSDVFGDFEFKGLEANSRYRVTIKKTGYVDR